MEVVDAVAFAKKAVNPPSLKAGFSLEDERRFRVYGTLLIQKAGILLRL